MGPHSSRSCLSSCGSARSRRNLSFSHRPRPPAQKTEASPFRLIFKPNQIRSDRHLQSPFCRVALALPTASPAPAQPVRVWLEAQAFRHRRSCGLKSAPGPTLGSVQPSGPARLCSGPGSQAGLADRQTGGHRTPKCEFLRRERARGTVWPAVPGSLRFPLPGRPLQVAAKQPVQMATASFHRLGSARHTQASRSPA